MAISSSNVYFSNNIVMMADAVMHKNKCSPHVVKSIQIMVQDTINGTDGIFNIFRTAHSKILLSLLMLIPCFLRLLYG